MKDVYELLRHKELEISTLQIEVEALRIVAPLLSDDNQVGNDNKLTSDGSTAPSPIRVAQAANANPQPEHAAEWQEKAKGWP